MAATAREDQRLREQAAAAKRRAAAANAEARAALDREAIELRLRERERKLREDQEALRVLTHAVAEAEGEVAAFLEPALHSEPEPAFGSAGTEAEAEEALSMTVGEEAAARTPPPLRPDEDLYGAGVAAPARTPPPLDDDEDLYGVSVDLVPRPDGLRVAHGRDAPAVASVAQPRWGDDVEFE
jgi:hypothetical protein